jgi:hypothetical protein
VLIACALLPVSALSQETTTSSQRQNENTIEGTVVSSTRDTLVVKTEDNQFQLFTFDRDTVKPRSLPANARVRVVSTPGEEAGVRLASTVSILEAAPTAQGTASAQAQPFHRRFGAWSEVLNDKPDAGASACVQVLLSIPNSSCSVCTLS